MSYDDEPLCDLSGECEAKVGARGITNCIHCGKELRESNGWWYTWDADEYPYPRPQCPVS